MTAAHAWRGILAVALGLTGVIGMAATPAAAAPNRNVTITIGTLTCFETEDFGDDETLLRAIIPRPGNAISFKEFSKSMNASKARTFVINQKITYNPAKGAWGDGSSPYSPLDGGLGLELFDQDNPPMDMDDSLGTQTISTSTTGKGVLNFEANGARYQLTYEVK